MLKLLFIVFVISLIVPDSSIEAQELPELQINSERYILIDAQSGHVYAQKGARDEVAIASLTKVFTAVQALEMASPDTLITTTEDDLFGPSHSLMGFGPNETYTLEDLIYGLMLPSGNDAAYAIARSLGERPGDTPEQAVERFMDLLNQRVRDMGLVNTHLVTPSGWGVPGHHSSAWDVAAMMQHALQYPLIVDAISSTEYTTSNGLMYLSNNNRLLRSYDALLGGKTGYDLDSGYCLVEVAEQGDRRMISVTLDGIAPDDWYDDNRVLLEYGFQQDTSTASAPWSGTVVEWQNPDMAQITRSAAPNVHVGPGNARTDQSLRIDSNDSFPAAPTVAIDQVAAGSVGASVAVLTLLILARGVIAFVHWPLGRKRPIDAEPGAL